MLGQIATFVETLNLTYDDVVYKIPYRNMILMQKDILHTTTGDYYVETSGREMLKRKGKKNV